MTRALIVGPRDELEATVDALYELKLVHIVDHKEGEEGLEIGKPLGKAAEASEILVKLRSIESVLKVEEPRQVEEQPLAENLRERILSLELNISEEDAAKKKTQALLVELDQKIDAITPLTRLPLSLDDYRGYETLDVFVGRAAREIEGLEDVTTDLETFSDSGLVVVFVAKDHGNEVREFLARHGFTAISVPEGTGRPREILEKLLAERERWGARLAEIEKRLLTLRERYAGFLAAARAHLEVTVEKAESPLRFAVTEHTFIVEGWIPEGTFSALETRVANLAGVFASELETEHQEAAIEPPTLLKNPRPIRPFELLVKMFGTPTYEEIDPTVVLSLAFPMMFGIMVGDLGYGLVWLLYGLWLLRRWKDRPWDFWKSLTAAFVWGGFWASVFGTFVFGEAFGIPFHSPGGIGLSRAEAFNWSDNILGLSIPLYPILEKLHQVSDFIVLSLAAAYIHLSTGFIIGFVNELRHNRKHALGKVSWLMILTGFFTIIMARAARWPGFGRIIWDGPLAWWPRDGLVLENIGFTARNPIPFVSIYLLVAGIGILLATEGGIHFMEVFSLVANVVSYARLAGIGVAEEAVIFAFNVIALEFMLFPWIDKGNVIGLIAGIAVMAVANLLLFILSTISGAIQAIRLHYVEFFLKFYKGAGTAFRPFGVKAQSEV